MNLENDKHWMDPSSMYGKSRRLVTIACVDTTGVLEHITKLLATGGSRVLDADVMLSRDNIVLVRASDTSERNPLDDHDLTTFYLSFHRIVLL